MLFACIRWMVPIAALTLLSIGSQHAAATGGDVEMSRISGDPSAPRRHYRLREPVRIDDARAMEIYNIARPSLGRGYAASDHSVAQSYLGWRRLNRAPYLSSTHGNHYVNNYYNDAAADYAKHENGVPLPQGAVIAKDSFAVTKTGGILLGPLFAMQKMAPGFNPVSGDWRYIIVSPDGRVLGETNGPGSERVEYCIACHLARESTDHLYFVPPAYR